MAETYDLAVIGGGSGGFGAALAGARLGLSTILIEKADMLGGASTRGGVNCWEMGAGGTGIPFDLYQRLQQIPDAVGIYTYGRHYCWHRPESEPYRFPGGEQLVDPERCYLDTLQRHGSQGMARDEAFCRAVWHGVPFEPRAMADAMAAMLADTGCCELVLNTTFTELQHAPARIAAATLTDGRVIAADAWVDGTGDAVLCAAAGCELTSGQEGWAAFEEPDAPEQADPKKINGATLIYRITPCAGSAIEPLPADVPEDCWWRDRFPGSCINQYPNLDRNINMLPTIEGVELVELGVKAAHAECRRRVLAHWHHMQRDYEEFRRYRRRWIAPALGVRESSRVVGEYVLTQHDLTAGLSGQQHADIICVADHALDTHGASTGRRGCGELREPFGVPFRCLIPKGRRNLLIACRGASFSSIAASSCRLTRTMMQLGQAAGVAAALARQPGTDLPAVRPAELRAELRRQHVQLEHPMPEPLRRHLA